MPDFKRTKKYLGFVALALALSFASSQAFAQVTTKQHGGVITPSKVVPLTSGAAIAIDASLGNVFTVTPGEAATITIANYVPGERYNLVVTTSGTSSYTLTLGTGFKVTGTLATGTSDAKVFVLSFVCDGISVKETSRTTAM